MDIYINREALSQGLARVQSVIERRGTNPLLSHVLLNAHSDGLRMTATDTEVAFIGDMEGNVVTPGQLAVDAARMFPIVRSLPDATVQLTTVGGNRLEVRSGRSVFKLPGVVAEEFPPLPAFDSKGTAMVRETDLRRLVEQASFAVATEDVRWGLNGVHMEVREANEISTLRFVATDGHRLSLAEAPFAGNVVLSPRMLVPRKALGVMRKLLSDREESIEVAFGDGAMRLSRPGEVFWFRMLDGEFPDYQAVIPSDNKHSIAIRRSDLASTLKRVSILIHKGARAVRFVFANEDLEIQVLNSDRGEVNETIPIELTGEPITAGFNVRYLQDILGVIGGDTVLLELAHPLAPCLLRNPNRDDAFFVVMPMRLD